MNKLRRLRSQADKLTYEKYLQPICEICGKRAIQLHHFYPKGAYGALRYTPENLISLCLGCHFRLTHQNRRLEDIIREKRGEEWYKELHKKSLEIKYSYKNQKYYEDIIAYLEKLIK
jgi:5-methylcytosine-specific restriction endonuclease McrA